MYGLVLGILYTPYVIIVGSIAFNIFMLTLWFISIYCTPRPHPLHRRTAKKIDICILFWTYLVFALTHAMDELSFQRELEKHRK